MLKTIFKTTGLMCLMSVLSMVVYTFLSWILNFFVFWELKERTTVALLISIVIYFISIFLFAKIEGYSLTYKCRFNKHEQFYGTVLGILIYSAVAFILIVSPVGIQNMFQAFYYIAALPAALFEGYVFPDLRNFVTFSDASFTVVVIETPIFIALRLIGLWSGYRRKIAETPAIEELNEKIQSDVQLPKPSEEKKSWRDSIDRME